MNKPEILVVTPVLNGERYLPELLASIRAQSYPYWNHIIVDGGSTDRSLQIAEARCAEDSRVSLVQAPGLKQYPSILRGWESGKGEILCWLNCDDLYTPWAFWAVAKRFQQTHVDWLTGLPAGWDPNGTLRFVRPYGRYSRRAIRSGWHHSQFLGFLQQESMFFRRDLLNGLTDAQKARFANADLAGDFLLWRSFSETARLHVEPTVLGGFRRHGSNLSVRNEDRYLSEVKQSGAPFPPRLVSALARRLFRLWSTLALLPSVETADYLLSSELEDEANG